MNEPPPESSAHPFFSPEEFHKTCLILAESFRRSGTEARWAPAKDSGYLLIRVTFRTWHEDNPDELKIDYHVLLSPTWQVPVLFFAPMWAASLEPLTLKDVYTFVVKKSFEEALQEVGVLGGISHGDHPYLGIPFYFIHPCRTADLLKDIQEDNKHISQEKLLQIWLGLVGGVVNLPAPSIELLANPI